MSAPAFPHTEMCDDGSYFLSHLGLTKREYFAGLAMQGIVASCNSRGVLMDTEIAPFAVKWADALIAALNAEPQS